MQEVIKQVMIYGASYLAVFLFAFIGMNVMSKGFLWKFIMVKRNKKKRILIFVQGVTGEYPKVGKVKMSEAHWKNNGRNNCSAPMNYDYVYDFGGIPAIDYDEVHNVFIKHANGTITQEGLDPVKVDIMVERAFYLGQLQGAKTLMIIMIIVIVVGAICAYNAYQLSQIKKMVVNMPNIIYNMTRAMPPVVGVA